MKRSIVPQLVRVWLPKISSFTDTLLVSLGKNSLIWGIGREVLSRSQGDLEAEGNVFYHVTTHGVMAGFPTTNSCLPAAEARAPAPF